MMTLVRYQNPFHLIENLLDHDFNRFGSKDFTKNNATLPSVNIIENDNDFKVEVAAPGFKKEDFKVELNNDVLTISSEIKTEGETSENGNYTKREFNYQSFKRTFTLPELAEDDNITAKYKNGILKITIPKMEEVKPKPVKQIAVL